MKWKHIIPIVEVEGIVGGNVYEVLNECLTLARMEHCIVKIKMNGKDVTVDEFRPFWQIIKSYETP